MAATNRKAQAKSTPAARETISASLATAVPSGISAHDHIIQIGQLHGQDLRRGVCALTVSELLSFMASGDVSRAARLAAVAGLDNIDRLIALAISDVAVFVRRAALRRIEEVLDGGPVESEKIERLLPCLDNQDLIAYTVALMDASDFDWCTCCNRSVGHVLCAAMSDCRSIDESVLLEDAFAQLAHCRADLRDDLQACTPESFIPRNVYTPMIASGPLLVDNVA